MGSVEIRHRDDTVIIGTQDNCIAAVWLGPPSIALLDTLQKHGTELAGRYPHGTLFLNIILRGEAKFNEQTRRHAARQTEENAMKAIAGAHVIAVKGLAAAATRGFIGTILMLARPKRPTKVFASMQAAAPWLVEQTERVGGGPTWTEKRLVTFSEWLIRNAR